MQPKTIKMLVIDTRTVTTNLDRAGYRSMGVTVKSAENFKEANEIIESRPIDIIVINNDYAGIDAPIAVTEFKKQDSTREIPVVVTSVQTSAETRKRNLNAGADLYVEQPIPRQYFIEKLKKLLEQQTRATERVSLNGVADIEFNGEKSNIPIGDLSTSGLLLTTDRDIEKGTKIYLSFEIPGYKKPIAVEGEVVRKIEKIESDPNRPHGLGVRFVDFQGDSEKRLEKYVTKTADENSRMIYYL